METDEVVNTIKVSLEFSKNGLVDEVLELHHQDYTRFSDLPPFRLQSRDEALKLKLSLMTELVDFEYRMTEPKVVIMGDVALAVFTMRYRGMAVNNYAFEGRMVDAAVRCSVVLRRVGRSWKILHEHVSRVPEGFSAD
ncbi:MAG: nuclear transport factor 2 family protein [Candidatus Caldarchaeum sp.]